MKETSGSLSSTKIHVAPFSWSRDYAQPQAGGIGSRGPGESQLELNRRSIRNQIADIERQLKIVEKNRETIREKRVDSTTFKIGLIGYTNAGNQRS